MGFLVQFLKEQTIMTFFTSLNAIIPLSAIAYLASHENAIGKKFSFTV